MTGTTEADGNKPTLAEPFYSLQGQPARLTLPHHHARQADTNNKDDDEAAPAPCPDLGSSAEAYERVHVHDVYEAIAPHFSATRHKPWPAVAEFLRTRPRGSIGLDVGCGNGKYLGVNADVFTLGSDRSSALVGLAGQLTGVVATSTTATTTTTTSAEPGPRACADVLVADGLYLPFRRHAADFAICIAVIHHLSTRARRQDAIRQLLSLVRRPDPSPISGPKVSGPATRTGPDHDEGSGQDGGGQVLVYTWALEQGTSRRGWRDGHDQDLLVPWVVQSNRSSRSRRRVSESVTSAGSSRGDQGDDDDNNYNNNSNVKVKIRNKHQPLPARRPSAIADDPGSHATGLGSHIPATAQAAAGGELRAPVSASAAPWPGHPGPADGDANRARVFQRYYHLYREGELDEDVEAAGGRVLSAGWERDNWWVIAGHVD